MEENYLREEGESVREELLNLSSRRRRSDAGTIVNVTAKIAGQEETYSDSF